MRQITAKARAIPKTLLASVLPAVCGNIVHSLAGCRADGNPRRRPDSRRNTSRYCTR